MKVVSATRPLAAASLACLLALSFINCGTSASAAASGDASGIASSEAGASGEAGSTGQQISVCGKVAMVECDPLTAQPCNIAAGETCDYDFGPGKFVCRKVPTFSRAGEACGANAPDCGPSTTCNDNLPKCQHFCCGDSDCEQGSCTTDIFEDGAASVGVCVDEFVAAK